MSDYYCYLALQAGWRWTDGLDEFFITLRGALVNAFLMDKDAEAMEERYGRKQR